MRELINSDPLFIDHRENLQVAITKIVSSYNDCFLATNENNVVGIVTCHDLLRSISSLGLERALQQDVSKVMSAPVEFASYPHLSREISRMSCDFSIKHFPVIRGKVEPFIKNIIGIVSSTNIGVNALAKKALDF